MSSIFKWHLQFYLFHKQLSKGNNTVQIIIIKFTKSHSYLADEDILLLPAEHPVAVAEVSVPAPLLVALAPLLLSVSVSSYS